MLLKSAAELRKPLRHRLTPVPFGGISASAIRARGSRSSSSSLAGDFPARRRATRKVSTPNGGGWGSATSSPIASISIPTSVRSNRRNAALEDDPGQLGPGRRRAQVYRPAGAVRMAAGGGPPFSRLSPKLVGLMLPSTIRASRSLLGRSAPKRNRGSGFREVRDGGSEHLDREGESAEASLSCLHLFTRRIAVGPKAIKLSAFDSCEDEQP